MGLLNLTKTKKLPGRFFTDGVFRKNGVFGANSHAPIFPRFFLLLSGVCAAGMEDGIIINGEKIGAWT